MFMKFWNTVGAMCRTCLTSPRLSFSAVVSEVSWSKVVPSPSRFSATKPRRSVTAASRPVVCVRHLVGRVGQHGGDIGQVRVERGEQVTARRQCRDQQLQIAHRAEDVGAVITKCRHRLGEFDYRVACRFTLTAQVGRRGVDELAYGAHSTWRRGLQGVGELLQLLTEVVPLDGHRGALLQMVPPAASSGSARVRGHQLDRPRTHQ